MTNEDTLGSVRVSNGTLATGTKPGARDVYSGTYTNRRCACRAKRRQRRSCATRPGQRDEWHGDSSRVMQMRRQLGIYGDRDGVGSDRWPFCRSLPRVPKNTAEYAHKRVWELCRKCVTSPPKDRETVAFTGSHREAFCGGKCLNRLREEVFHYDLVSLARIAFRLFGRICGSTAASSGRSARVLGLNPVVHRVPTPARF
jgi:hypothetical protein